MMPPNSSIFPILVRSQPKKNNKKTKDQAHLIQLEEEHTKATANLSLASRSYLSSLGISNPDSDVYTAGLIWMHTLAIGYSLGYLSENADGIRSDWPRVPLPNTKLLLVTSAELGENIAALLDTEKPVPGVTAAALRPEMQSIAIISRDGEGQLQPKSSPSLRGGGMLDKMVW